MSSLKTCPHCQSFNPSTSLQCLNCDHEFELVAVPSSSLTKRVLQGAGAIAISMTLSACYGQADLPCNIDEDEDYVCALDDCNDQDPEVGYCEGAGNDNAVGRE